MNYYEPFKQTPASEFPVEMLNAYFCSNFQTDVDSLCVSDAELPSIPLSLSCDEVCMMLRRLKNKSPGPDCLPAWVLRDLADVLSSPITHLFNWSLRVGYVPESFKCANVTPIAKCSVPSQPSDFRPISLLPILSKVLEKFEAKKWIIPCIPSSAHSSQYAYIPGTGRGTTTALTHLQHKVLQFLDSSSGSVRILSIDFAKAFDKILHSGVLDAACRFRLPKEAVLWIGSFLSGRLQRVCINGKCSPWRNVTSGVPQGSVIGPLLFCMFVDDLQATCDNSFTIKYADDITILHFIRCSSDDQLQREYDNAFRWSTTRRLPINESKCCVLDIITKKSLVNTPVRGPGNRLLPHVSSISLLGLTITNDMKWNSHIEEVLSKARRRLYILRNLRRSGCPSSHILEVYNSVIRSTLLYAYPAFCNLPQFLREKLLTFERRVFRIVGDTNAADVIETGEEMCRRLFKNVSCMSDHPLRQCFSHRSTVTRASMQLRPPRAKTKRLSHSFIRFAR